MQLAQFKKWSALAVLVAVTAAAPAATFAQTMAPAKTGTQFYMDYRVAFNKATKIEDLFPYISADMKQKVQATPADQRPQMFGMMKMMGTMTGIKVTKEVATATGATLTVTGVNSDKKTVTGTVTLVKEGGAWKVSQEDWPM